MEREDIQFTRLRWHVQLSQIEESRRILGEIFFSRWEKLKKFTDHLAQAKIQLPPEFNHDYFNEYDTMEAQGVRLLAALEGDNVVELANEFLNSVKAFDRNVRTAHRAIKQYNSSVERPPQRVEERRSPDIPPPAPAAAPLPVQLGPPQRVPLPPSPKITGAPKRVPVKK